MAKPWVPRPGEVIRLDFNPVAGHEQANLRPAVVLSNQGFNDQSSLVVCVPCTTKIKGFPFEVAIAGLPEPTVALAHQIRTLDWRECESVSMSFAAAAKTAEIREKLKALLGI